MQQHADIYLLQRNFAVNKDLHAFASVWIINTELRCMEP